MEVPNVSWEDIGGLKNVKHELQEVWELLETALIFYWIVNCIW